MIRGPERDYVVFGILCYLKVSTILDFLLMGNEKATLF